MKITINGKIHEDALKSILNSQKEKTKIITDFCKKEKLETFSYKDAELEFEYEIDSRPVRAKKIEVRTDDKGN